MKLRGWLNSDGERHQENFLKMKDFGNTEQGTVCVCVALGTQAAALGEPEGSSREKHGQGTRINFGQSSVQLKPEESTFVLRTQINNVLSDLNGTIKRSILKISRWKNINLKSGRLSLKL